MKKYEYMTRAIDAGGFWGGKFEESELDAILNEMGRDGWALVQSTTSNQSYGSTRYMICIFMRELA